MGKEGKLVKKDILFLVSLSVIFGFIVFVLANTLSSPVTYGNYSSTINFTCVTGLTNATNASLYAFNSTAPYSAILVATVANSSVNQSVFNISGSISGFTTGTYNFSCLSRNYTDVSGPFSTNVTNVTIDNTAPNASFYVTSYDTYVNSSIVLSARVNDTRVMGRDYINVRFNITNSSGAQINFTNATTTGNGFYNLTVNFNSFADGAYNVTIYANETNLKNALGVNVANLNNSEKLALTVDNTAPTVTYTCSPNTTVGQIVTCLCTSSDSVAGVNYTTDTDTTGTTSITTTITVRSTGTFSRTCTAMDKKGNVGTAVATYKITDNTVSSGGSSSSTSKTTTFTYSKTIAQTSEDLSTMNTIETSSFVGGGLGAKEKVTFLVKNQAHYIGVRSLTANSVTIEIASDPIQINLGIGVETKQDLDGDGYYDIAVKLNSITNSKADLTITYIQEQTPTTTPTTTTPTTTTEPTGSKPSGISVWVWIIIAVIILAAIVAGVIILSKKKRR